MAAISTCPAANVAVPVEDVWALLMHPARYDDKWWDIHIEQIVPEGSATAGQVIKASGRAMGIRARVNLAIEAVDPDKHQIRFTVHFPFGIVSDNTITCTPIDEQTCYVQYG